MKKTVFISSTYEDLREHRRAVWETLEKFDVDVRGMERFGARPQSPIETCLAEVDQCDVYVGIIGLRLGSVAPDSGKSFTQFEYERARERQKHILIYLIDEKEAQFRLDQIDLDPVASEQLKSFKKTLRGRHTVDVFADAKDLAAKLERDFKNLLSPKAGQEEPSSSDQYELSKRTLKEFMLTPKRLSGSEVLLQVRIGAPPFAASRGLCHAFSLPYGDTAGVPISILEPKDDCLKEFGALYSSDTRLQELLSFPPNTLLDVYVRLEFSQEDVSYSHARFFASSHTNLSALCLTSPISVYEPAEGRMILLYSKASKSSESDEAQHAVHGLITN